MRIDFSAVNLLSETEVKRGEKWIYAADFNTAYTRTESGGIRVKNPQKLECELDDLNYLLEHEASVAILAHQGRYKDGSAKHLDLAAEYLSELLDRDVRYFPENASENAARFAKQLKPGEIAIMGNTRFHEGEEKNDPKLAEKFARLGEFAAIGGFAKSHRENASNVGILNFVRGCLSESQKREMEALEKWAGREKTYSLAVVGGAKKEKITLGFKGFSETYDALIPGGIVLNTLYRFLGYGVGDSLISDEGRTYERHVGEVMRNPEKRKKIAVPKKVIVARRKNHEFVDVEEISIERGVRKGFMIVDFYLPEEAYEALDRVVEENGRMVMAGTPTLYTEGFTHATDEILAYMRKCEHALVIGGDTTAEVEFEGATSPGGGAALYYLVRGTTKVFEALKRNKRKFGRT